MLYFKSTAHGEVSRFTATRHPHFTLRDDSLYAKMVRVHRDDGIRFPFAFKDLVEASIQKLFFKSVEVQSRHMFE